MLALEGYAKQKVPGGKLLAIRIRYEGGIEAIQITGDFLLYPEEKISEIEHALLGAQLSQNEESLASIVKKAAEENGIELIGVTPEAIASTIKMAVMQRSGV